MQRTRLFLARHGQVEGHREKRYNGQGNVALTAHGRRQSEAIAARLAAEPLAAVYSSDLDRTVHAAERIAARHGLEAGTHAGFRELHIGAWEGMTWRDLQATYPAQWQARLDDLVNYRVPGGESLQDAADRVRPVLRRCLEAHPADQVALVGHGGINRIILLDAIGAPLERVFAIEQDYGCLNIIDYFADGNCVVRLLNGPNPAEDPCSR